MYQLIVANGVRNWWETKEANSVLALSDSLSLEMSRKVSTARLFFAEENWSNHAGHRKPGFILAHIVKRLGQVGDYLFPG